MNAAFPFARHYWEIIIRSEVSKSLRFDARAAFASSALRMWQC
jgi:hypothetical protein